MLLPVGYVRLFAAVEGSLESEEVVGEAGWVHLQVEEVMVEQ